MYDIVTVTVNYKMKDKVLAMLRSLFRDTENRDISNFAAQNLETSHFSRDDALVTVCQKIVRHLEKHTVQTRNRKSSVVIFSFLE